MFKEITSLPELKIAGVLGKVFHGKQHETIPELWEKLQKIKPNLDIQTPERCIGLEIYDPEAAKENAFLYMPSFAINDVKSDDENITIKLIPSGEYAVFTHKGSIENLHTIFPFIYKEWMPNSSYKVRAAYDLEWYDERFKGMSPDSEVDIYVPVSAKE